MEQFINDYRESKCFPDNHLCKPIFRDFKYVTYIIARVVNYFSFAYIVEF